MIRLLANMSIRAKVIGAFAVALSVTLALGLLAERRIIPWHHGSEA